MILTFSKSATVGGSTRRLAPRLSPEEQPAMAASTAEDRRWRLPSLLRSLAGSMQSLSSEEPPGTAAL